MIYLGIEGDLIKKRYSKYLLRKLKKNLLIFLLKESVDHFRLLFSRFFEMHLNIGLGLLLSSLRIFSGLRFIIEISF